MTTEAWTPEEARLIAVNTSRVLGEMQSHADPWKQNAARLVRHLHHALDILDAQQAELATAREVVKYAREVAQLETENDMYELTYTFPELLLAIDDYDALRGEGN